MILIWISIAIICGAIYLIIKQHEARLVLFSAGLLMALLAGKPLEAFTGFVSGITQVGIIQTVCTVMGFAYVMNYTECDKHLVTFCARGLVKVRPLLIPGATLITFAINIALPSAVGVAATVGTIFIPLLIRSGVHPATAATAVMGGTFGSVLSPGLAHNPFVAKIANLDVMQVISIHAKADIVAGLIVATSITIIAKFLKEDTGYISENAELEDAKYNMKINPLFAVIPIIPIVILMLGATGLVPVLKKIAVPHAMMIGCIVAVVAVRPDLTKLSKAFFEGMGTSFGSILGLIACAGTFVAGMKATNLIDTFITILTHAGSFAKYAAAFGPYILSVIVGSGDAAAFAFNESVTPHAQQFGMQIANMGSMAVLGGAIGRIASPITPATIVCASLAGVSPVEVAKRNIIGTIIAVTVSMFILL